MSEYRNPDAYENITEVPYTEQTRKTQKSSNRRNRGAHPAAVIAASAAVSMLCGVGGGWFAATHIGNANQTVVYQTVESSNVSPVTSAAGQTGLTIAQVAEKASPSVVEIVTEITQQSYGSRNTVLAPRRIPSRISSMLTRAAAARRRSPARRRPG